MPAPYLGRISLSPSSVSVQGESKAMFYSDGRNNGAGGGDMDMGGGEF